MIILAENRINCCQLFSEGSCPQQTEMERLYLVPQFLDAIRIKEYHITCYGCSLYMNRFFLLAGSQLHIFTQEAKISI